MRGLQLRVRIGNVGPGFAQSKTQLPKEPLALPNLQLHAMLAAKIFRESWAIPHLCRQAHLSGRRPQDGLDFGQLTRAQTTGTARALSLGQTRQSLGFEALNPVHDAAGRIPKQFSDLRARHALRHEQHSMESMIVARSVVAPDLILKGHDHVFFVRDSECIH